MKQLILVRHAKSSWEYSVNDEDRPLKPKGIERAIKISSILKEKLDFIPELWLSSYANRALHTASIFAQSFNRISELRINSDLYTFSSESLKRAVEKLPNQYNSAILFGHNEAITNFANTMGSEFVENIPTAGVVAIDFQSKAWASIGKGETKFIIIPKKVQS